MEHGAPTIEKQQFENRGGGWEGVVVINGKGEAVGASVAPGGRVWLSEAEKVLTAEAPQSPASNPFAEQRRIRQNPETGVREEYSVTPLVPVSSSRFVPSSDRYVPPAEGAVLDAEAAAAAREEEPVTTTTASDPRRAAEEETTAPQPPARARQAVEGKLGGADAPPAEETPPAPPATLDGENPSERADEPERAAIREGETVEEEQAAKVEPEVGEETGAAPQPQGDAVEGEYAQHEEVGTPVPAEESGATPGMAGPPAPYSPGSQPG